MSTQIASPQNVSSGISCSDGAAREIVAQSVDVRRRMVGGDDHLGVEGRVARRRIGVLDVPEDLRRCEERVQL